jgi:MFS family permease
MLFGMPSSLLPALSEQWGGPRALGWLNAAPFIGAAAITLFSGWTHRVRRHGAGVALSAGVWGIAIVLFGLSRSLAPAVLFLAISGALDMTSGLFRMRISNETVPDHMRGRIGGLEIVAYLTGPYLGNFEAGIVAHAWSVKASVISGGVLCVVAVVAVVLFLPGLWRYVAAAAPAERVQEPASAAG